MKRLFFGVCLMMIYTVSYADIASVGYVDDVLSTKQNTLTAGDGITIASDGTISADVTVVEYGTGTADTSGTTKLYDSTGTNTDGTITQKAITTALGTKQDALPTGPIDGEKYGLTWDANIGQFVYSRYYVPVSTTYGTADSETSGLTRLYNSVGPATDGTMTQKSITTALETKQDVLPTGPNDNEKYGLAWDGVSGQFIYVKYITPTTMTCGYTTGNVDTSGLSRLYNMMGPATDGTMTQKSITTALETKQEKLTGPNDGEQYTLVWDGANQQFIFEKRGE